MLLLSQLQAICKTDAGRLACVPYLQPLNDFMPKYQINTVNRVTMFLAQVMHESEEFTHVVENLNYRAQGLANTWPHLFKDGTGNPNAKALALQHNPQAIANYVYANKNGNGDEASGDGWKYRGQGPIELTFRDTITMCGNDIDVDLEHYPERLQEPAIGTESACWFWGDFKKLNSLADICDFKKVSERVAGSDIGLADRESYWELAKKVITAI